MICVSSHQLVVLILTWAFRKWSSNLRLKLLKLLTATLLRSFRGSPGSPPLSTVTCNAPVTASSNCSGNWTKSGRCWRASNCLGINALEESSISASRVQLNLLNFKREKDVWIESPLSGFGANWKMEKNFVTPEEAGAPAVENIGLGGSGGSCHKRRWAAIWAHILSGEVSNIRGAPKSSVAFFAPLASTIFLPQQYFCLNNGDFWGVSPANFYCWSFNNIGIVEIPDFNPRALFSCGSACWSIYHSDLP